MEHQNFNATVSVNAPPAKVLKKIAQVDHWWAKDFSGSAESLNDQFTIRFKDTFVDFKISEFIPDSKVAWHVTDCNLPFQENRTEWVDTTVLFELSRQIDQTEIRFTHIGLAPEVDCYEQCSRGWTRFVLGSLPKWIDEDQGHPE